MRRLAALTVLVGLLTGCDQVFGLAPPSPDDSLVTGRYRRILLEPTPGVPSPVDVPQPAQVSVMLADGEWSAVELADDGGFVFTRTGDEPYRLRIVPTNGTPTEYQLSARALDLGPKVPSRPDAVPPLPDTQLHVRLNAPQDMGTSYIHTTGAWGQVAQDPQQNDQLLELDWTQRAHFFGTPALLDAMRGDRLYCSYWEPTSKYDQMIAFGEAPAMMMNNGELNQVSCELTSRSANSCVDLDIGYSNEDRRLRAASDLFPNVGSSTVVMALPLASHSPAGFWLAHKLGAPSEDYVTQVGFVQPFPNYQVAVLASATRQRELRYSANASPVIIGNYLHRWLLAADLECGSPVDATLSLALPTLPILGDTEITSDGQVVLAADTLSWSLVPGGESQRYVARLYQIDTDGEQTTQTLVAQWIALEQRVAIDPAVFVAGARYLFTIESNLGLPGAATGDMVTIEYPYGLGLFTTPMFEIAR